jgi:DNA polymerase-3 subunit alpha
VRFGLGAVKGAGEGAIRSILAARAELGGRITSLFELTEHTDLRLVNKKVLDCLAKAGVFDSIAPDGRDGYLAWRPRVLGGLDRVLDHGARVQKDRDQGQSHLFGDAADAPADVNASLAAVRAWTETEALAGEKEALGLYMSGHPLQRFQAALAAAGARRLESLTASDPDCAIAGIVTGLRPLKTKRGDRMAVFSLEDETAKVETVVFPECFGKFGRFIVDDAMLVVRGKYERDEESSRLVAAEITPLEVIRDRAVREVEIRLVDRGLARQGLRELAEVLDRHAGDRRVSVIVETSGGPHPLRVRAATARRIKPSDLFVRDVEAVCGSGTVLLK